MKLDKECRRLLIYSRLSSLSQLYFFSPERVSYAELKAEVGIADSFIGPQLKWLESKGYIKEAEEGMDDSKETVYYITEKGKEKYKTVLEWLISLPTIKIRLNEDVDGGLNVKNGR